MLLKNKDFGKTGTPEHNKYEFDLKPEVFGHTFQWVRRNKKLTRQDLTLLVGVQ